MSLFVVPDDTDHWPSLGKGVCDFIEDKLVHGPGDLRGHPARLDKEKRGLIYHLYEVYPKDHPNAGRRRFRRGGISLRKGSAKTELAAWIAAVELHPEGPVRTIGWDGDKPLGGPVTDPYIPMVAYTEEQSEELAYGTLLVVLQEGPLGKDFDLGLTRIMRLNGEGKAQALANAPGARDGARTTFQVFDESHRLTLPKQKAAHRTMLANLPKRLMADPWSLEITTAFSPGEGSVAEDTMDYARAVASGEIKDSKLFFFHRQASDKHDMTTPEGIRAAVIEASGPVAEWSDIDGIVEQWQDPKADRTFLERVWTNRPIQQASRAFDAEAWRGLAREPVVGDDGMSRPYLPKKGAHIVLGFDGARFHDSTALIGTEIETGHMFLLGLWERPLGWDTWEVPVAEMDARVATAFDTWKVWRMYADPPYWETKLDEWAGKYGEEQINFWWTRRERPMSSAISAFAGAILAGELTHDGNPDLARHIGNAVKRALRLTDDQGKPLYTIHKERPDSPHKIDAAVAAVLSWEARGDALKAGVLSEPKLNIFFVGGRK